MKEFLKSLGVEMIRTENEKPLKAKKNKANIKTVLKNLKVRCL